jgi:hypothetical protein
MSDTYELERDAKQDAYEARREQSYDTLMRCADEALTERGFIMTAPGGFGRNPEYTCLTCGWIQASTANGCAELCEAATWHDRAEYVKYRDIARAGGYDVPDDPPRFVGLDIMDEKKVLAAAKWLVRCDALGLDLHDPRHGKRGASPWDEMRDAVRAPSDAPNAPPPTRPNADA